MPIDRAAALRNAEKLLRQGKSDAAIAEYLRIVEDQPRDWNTANVLGDLYVRSGRQEAAIEQFIRIADGFSGEGFLQKAGALYKKVLKLDPNHERALLGAAEVATTQGLLADARVHLNTIIERRRARGDGPGAAEIRARLAALDPSDEDVRPPLPEAHVTSSDFSRARDHATTVDHRRALAEPEPDPERAIADQLNDPTPAGERALEAVDAVPPAEIPVEVAAIPVEVPVEVSVEVPVHVDVWTESEVLPPPDAPAPVVTPAPAERRAPQMKPPHDSDGTRSQFALSSNAIDLAAFLAELEEPSASVHAASDSVEVDLSIVLNDVARKSPVSVPIAPPAHTAPSSLDEVFEGMRGQANLRSGDPAEVLFRRALALQDAGDIDECLQALQEATRSPRLRFQAAALAGRILRREGDVAQAIEWLERAAQAPAPAPEESHELLYELAECLETCGEGARALAVLLELQADAGQYRDLEARVDRLTKAQAQG